MYIGYNNGQCHKHMQEINLLRAVSPHRDLQGNRLDTHIDLFIHSFPDLVQ